MDRKKRMDRMARIVRKATRSFLIRGYRRTQVADIAEDAGIAEGTVFNYFESKEALFDFLIRASVLQSPLENWQSPPIPTPEPGATLEFLKAESQRINISGTLKTAIGKDTCPDPGLELEAIIRHIFRQISTFHVLYLLVEKSALDWPEMEIIWREHLVYPWMRLLEQYLDKRISQGHLRRVRDTHAAMWSILWLIDFFAKDRPYSPEADRISEEVGEETVLEIALRTFIL